MLHEFLPVEINPGERSLDEFANGVSFIRGEDEIVALGLLQHSPHSLDEFRGITPIPFCVEIAEEQFLLQAEFNRGDSPRDFAGYERLAAPRAFVVEQNAVARIEPITFAIVDRRPI